VRDTSPVVDARRYCSASIRFPIGESLELVHSQHSGALRTLTPEAAALLDSCRTFKTIEEHARELGTMIASRRNQVDEMLMNASASILPSFIARLLRNGTTPKRRQTPKIDSRQFELIQNQLYEFVAGGLMVSDRDLMNLLAAPVDPEMPTRITSVGIVTHDRVAALTRCLESYIENAKRFDRNNEFVVVDDSEQPQARQNNREALESLKNQHCVNISYAGPDEKKRFAVELERRAGIPSDVLTFALFGLENLGPSIGANRNSLLLQTVGEMVLSADDDSVCRAAPSPQLDERLSFFSKGDPTQFWFFPTRDALINSATFVDKDILAIHEELLGKDLRGCVAEKEDVELSQASSEFLRGLDSGKQRVLFTFTGILGDSGMHSPHSYFLLADESRRRLVASDQQYKSATTSREILRVVNQPTISSSWWFPTTAFAFDNCDMVPPFFPVLRNEDGVFGVTVRSCFEETFVGCLPWALLHSPIESRSYTRADFSKSAASCRLCDILSACVSAFVPPLRATSKSERLKQLGEFLLESASLTLPEFEEFVRVQLYRVATGYASQLEADLRYHQGGPSYWADDVKTYLSTLVDALSRKEYVTPRDVVGLHNGESPGELTQMLVLSFGKLLCWWPEIVETAKEMKAEGLQLAVRI
jgi:hypothetical protein